MEENESRIYKGDDGYLYTYEERTGRIWSLTSAEYAGEAGKPMPESIKGIGKMTLLGVFKLDD